MNLPKKAVKFLSPLHRFLQHEATSGILLMGCIVVAMSLANSPYAHEYEEFWHLPITLGLGPYVVSYPLHFWINDALISLFFVVVGLEIKREILTGELSSMKKASMPIVAALGGMIFPAIIYSLFNWPGTPTSSGWGIPIATDIAFAIGVLMLFGDRVPLSLKVFLLALAIVDDIGAILVIVLFYSKGVSWLGVAAAGVITASLILINRLRVYSTMPYCILGVLLWIAILNSGIHATISGVILAFTVPASVSFGTSGFLAHSPLARFFKARKLPAIRLLGDKLYKTGTQTLEKQSKESLAPLQRMEHTLHPWVTYAILPLFALANAGVSLAGSTMALWLNTVTFGVTAGLLIGKPLGITFAVWMAQRLKWIVLPEGVTLTHIASVGFLGGIGFTMSLFIADLSFHSPVLLKEAKMGIILASLLAGLFGGLLLSRLLEKTASPDLDHVS